MKITFEIPYEDSMMIDVKAILQNNNVEINADLVKVTVIIEDGFDLEKYSHIHP